MKRDIVYRENCWVRFGKLGGVPSSPFSLTASAQTDGPILPAVWLCGSVSGTPPPPGLTHLFLYFSCLLPPPLPHGCRGNVTREALLALHPLSPGSPPPFRGAVLAAQSCPGGWRQLRRRSHSWPASTARPAPVPRQPTSQLQRRSSPCH